MKKYMVVLDEEQMEFIKTTMESQVEISTDVVADAHRRYKDHQTDSAHIEYINSLESFATALAIDNLLNRAKEMEPGSPAPEERKTPDDNVNVHRDKLAGIYNDVCAICTGYETGEDDKASDMYYRLVDVLDTMVNLGFDEF